SSVGGILGPRYTIPRERVFAQYSLLQKRILMLPVNTPHGLLPAKLARPKNSNQAWVLSSDEVFPRSLFIAMTPANCMNVPQSARILDALWLGILPSGVGIVLATARALTRVARF